MLAYVFSSKVTAALRGGIRSAMFSRVVLLAVVLQVGLNYMAMLQGEITRMQIRHFISAVTHQHTDRSNSNL